MTPLEAKLSALIDDCEKILKPYTERKQKWVISKRNQMRLITVVDEKSSILLSYVSAISKIRALKSYQDAEIMFDRDSVFSAAQTTAGGGGPQKLDNVVSSESDRKRRI